MRVYIKTYGCQMNERDSEALAGMLTARGCTIAASEEEGDVFIFNTCSVREQAERKAVGKIGHMKKLKMRRPEIIIGVIGCMAQNRGEALLAELPVVDFVLGSGELHRLPEVLDELAAERRQIAKLELSDAVLNAMDAHYTLMTPFPFKAQIAITRGCNRFCSYCIVPYVRGREYSRTLESILAEAEELVANGVVEIMLLGQNVAAFGLNGEVTPPADDAPSPFAELLRELAKIEKLKRIRFTSPYPSYFNADLRETIVNEPKICRQLHLPLQSGSAQILKAMNRQYTPEQYRELTTFFKRELPEMNFSTDIIVGFPGETAEDFQATRELMEEVGFDQAFIFKYSPRQGTKAADWPDQLPQEVKEERNQILLADLERRSQKRNQALIGTEQQILIEGVSPRNPERWSGRTDGNRTVIFLPETGDKPGEFKTVTIAKASSMSLFASGVIPEDEEI